MDLNNLIIQHLTKMIKLMNYKIKIFIKLNKFIIKYLILQNSDLKELKKRKFIIFNKI